MADRARSVVLAALAGVAAWLTLGIQAVVDDGTRARVGALPAWWVLAALQVACVGAVILRRTPARRLAPLLVTTLIYLPWLPGPVPPAFLIWYGPLSALVWILALTGLAAPMLARTGSTAWATDPRRAPLLLACLTAVLCGGGAWSMRDRLPAGDESHYLVITQSLLFDGDLRIEDNHQRGDYTPYHPGELRPDYLQRGQDGAIYSIHAPGVSVLVAPAFAVAGWPGAVVAMIAMAAATAALVWLLAWRLTGDHSAGWIAGATAALSAPGYFHGFTIFPDGAGALAVAIALGVVVRLERGQAVSPAGLALAGTALATLPWLHTRFAILAGGLGLILLVRLVTRASAVRSLVALFSVPVVSALAWFGFFWVIWGTPNPAAPYGQATQSAWAHLTPAVPGLLFDQQFGLIPNAPVYALALLGLGPLAVRHPRLALELALLFVTYLLAVGSYRMWWGGHSAPARFLVAALPLLAPPLAVWWSQGSAARRAFTLLLFLLGLTLVLARVVVDHGGLVYNERDGVDLLLEWANRSVNMPLAWPSLHRDVVGDAWEVIAVWFVTGALCGGITLLAARRVGQAWTLAGLALAATVMGASSLVWQGPSASVTTVRSALDLLDRWPDRTRAVGWQSRPYGLVPPEVLPRQLVLSGIGRTARPRGAAAPVFSATLVPGGHYALGTTGPRPNGRLAISVGAQSPELEVIDLGSAEGGVPPRVIAVPVRVQSLTMVGDEAARASIGRLTLHPVRVGPAPGAPASTAHRAARYGPWRVFAFDENVYLEGPGFWTGGFATSELFIDAAGGARPPSERGLSVQLRAGPVTSSVRLTSGAWHQSVTLQPGETTVVTLPDLGPEGRTLRLETATGFRPAQHDASNRDMRTLGVWVEAEGK